MRRRNISCVLMAVQSPGVVNGGSPDNDPGSVWPELTNWPSGTHRGPNQNSPAVHPQKSAKLACLPSTGPSAAIKQVISVYSRANPHWLPKSDPHPDENPCRNGRVSGNLEWEVCRHRRSRLMRTRRPVG
jgi:hypothetical protein